MSPIDSEPRSVEARRVYAQSVDRVYQAFTSPEQIAKWLSPSDDVSTTVHEFDLRPGGGYRLGFLFPDGRTDYVVGRYLEVLEGRRLVFTWTWEEPDVFAGLETLVRVEFRATGQGAEVSVCHERFPTEERRRIHDDGWRETLERLARFLLRDSEE